MLCPRGFRKQIKSKSGRLYASTLHACSLLLVQRFEKTSAHTTSGHQKMISPHSFRLHLILGGRAGNMLPSQHVVGGGGVPDKPGRKPHSSWEDKVYACLCNKAKQMDTLEEEKAAKNITMGLTNTHSEISFSSRSYPRNLISTRD